MTKTWQNWVCEALDELLSHQRTDSGKPVPRSRVTLAKALGLEARFLGMTDEQFLQEVREEEGDDVVDDDSEKERTDDEAEENNDNKDEGDNDDAQCNDEY